MDRAQAKGSGGLAEGVLRVGGDLHSFLGERDAFGELTDLGERRRQPGAGVNREDGG